MNPIIVYFMLCALMIWVINLTLAVGRTNRLMARLIQANSWNACCCECNCDCTICSHSNTNYVEQRIACGCPNNPAPVPLPTVTP